MTLQSSLIFYLIVFDFKFDLQQMRSESIKRYPVQS